MGHTMAAQWEVKPMFYEGSGLVKVAWIVMVKRL